MFSSDIPFNVNEDAQKVVMPSELEIIVALYEVTIGHPLAFERDVLDGKTTFEQALKFDIDCHFSFNYAMKPVFRWFLHRAARNDLVYLLDTSPKLKIDYALPDIPNGFSKCVAVKHSNGEITLDFLSDSGRLASETLLVAMEWPWLQSYTPKDEDWKKIGFILCCL